MNLDNWVNFFKLSILCTHLLVVTTVMSMYFVAYMFFLKREIYTKSWCVVLKMWDAFEVLSITLNPYDAASCVNR